VKSKGEEMRAHGDVGEKVLADGVVLDDRSEELTSRPYGRGGGGL
jgi:hypothetical protein